MTAQLQLVRPNNENRSVRAKRRAIPTRPSNRDLRPREYLTPSEIEKLISAARKGLALSFALNTHQDLRRSTAGSGESFVMN